MNPPQPVRPSRFDALLYGLLFLLLGLAHAPRPTDAYFEVSKNLDVFGKLLKEVSINYVDEIETNKFVRKGVDAMLASLDPYTNFIPASDIEEYRFMSTGEYGGIGARISKRNDDFIIVEPYEGRPAQKAGLRAGDILLKLNNEELDGKKFSVQDVSNMLRGEAKKEVSITVRRPGEPNPLQVKVVRETIKIDNVPWFGMLNDSVGYIALEGFTRDATAEVRKAYLALKKEHPKFSALILDLRGNPGGLLFEAIGIANLFIAKGEKVVETKGRMEGSLRVYKAEQDPLDTQIPVVVLLNGRSASASEIVAGVLQDLDRGVVVGRRSYGKGLVQTTRPLSYNNQLKITTARYYTPSGRCIQAINYANRTREGSVLRTPDSLAQIFKTRKGRPVKDAGGILPDLQVKSRRLHKVTQDLLTGSLIFDFATQYRSKHPSLPTTARDFEVDDALYREFVEYVRTQKFEYKTEVENDLAFLRDELKREAYYQQVEPQLMALMHALEQQRGNDIFTYQEEIKDYLEAEIVSRYYYSSGRLQAALKNDDDVVASLKLLANRRDYQAVFSNLELKEYQPDDDDPEAEEELETGGEEGGE